MARRYNPSRFGISRGDGLPPEPYFRNVPSATKIPDEEYNRMLMQTYNKTEEATKDFHRHLVNKLDYLNSVRTLKHKKNLWYNRRYAGGFTLFAFGICILFYRPHDYRVNSG